MKNTDFIFFFLSVRLFVYIYHKGGTMNKQLSKTTTLLFCALCIALNIVLGIVMAAIKFPVYLDTIGTIFTAVCFGPVYGVCVGALTNFLTAIISGSLGGMPFMLVNIAIGLVVGLIFRKFRLTLASAIITGIIIGIIAPVIGTPIGIVVYGGLTGTVSDIAVAVLKQSGMGIFAASFIPKLFNNLLDKTLSVLIVFFLIKALPAYMKPTCLKAKARK